MKAHYVAERSEIAARYAEREIVGQPKYRQPCDRTFTLWRRGAGG